MKPYGSSYNTVPTFTTTTTGLSYLSHSLTSGLPTVYETRGKSATEEAQRAALRECPETVAFLLEDGADVHANKDEALRQAAADGYFRVVQVLMQHGANVHAEGDEAFRNAF
ncbi:hypothetical protein PhCBS80983_g04118 [Powellomyces hirtus]|uniref:Uncharacterized protein n=1 Tax=Powellomyces hirtus TaxID=109895 RepID=A0A507DYX1_9FUNG|nr:hypothetical protein PhCBS80983_g04118 [Powellomyces hirtus]